MVHNVAGVILAGGASKRFNGIIKAKIAVKGKTIISRILDTYNDIFEENLIVTNSPEEFADFADSCIIFGDRYLNKGPLGGIHSALSETTREAVFIAGGDMPFLEKGLILRQISFFEKNNCDAVIPVSGENIEPLHGIYKKSILGSLEEYIKSDNNCSIREFFKEINICYFPVEDSEKSRMAFTNINTPSDLAAADTYLESTN
jgi:molybdopterin-guanine dinucleotide biosynthesis protein A